MAVDSYHLGFWFHCQSPRRAGASDAASQVQDARGRRVARFQRLNDVPDEKKVQRREVAREGGALPCCVHRTAAFQCSSTFDVERGERLDGSPQFMELQPLQMPALQSLIPSQKGVHPAIVADV